MTITTYTVSQIASICGGKVISSDNSDPVIRELLIDSRRLIYADNCLFIALVSERNDGHKYISELYEKGVRAFMISELHWKFLNDEGKIEQSNFKIPGKGPASPTSQLINLPTYQLTSSTFILVSNTLTALQRLGAYHRHQFDIPVIGITGSNGKTIVKEWLFQLLCRENIIIRSPKSYNSQIGVPLSVWKMAPEHNLAIFEAGISRPGEMENLEPIISPTIGIFTNIGHAHDERFVNQRQKVEEKLRLFINARYLVYCADYPLITECIQADMSYQNLKTFTWSRYHEADLSITSVEKENGKTRILAIFKQKTIDFSIPFIDEASIENAIHCLALELLLETLAPRPSSLVLRYSSLVPIAMRLELKEAINHCSLINDSYNSDINSLSIALDFLSQQNQQQKKSIILSDILQTGRNKPELYKEIAELLASRNITRIIGIGRDMVKNGHAFPMEGVFYLTTDDFLSLFPLSSFQHEIILLKGARLFEFEKISQVLQQMAHETVMEITLEALVHNLNYFRSGLHPGTKTMAMVKAFSYGSGSFEIANVLQFHRVDYLAVAYTDEGVELRKAGVHLPVMVMSPEEQSLETLLKYNLEPEIYNLHILGLLEEAIARNVTSIQQEVRIHIKIDTGMHRLGFMEEELDQLIDMLKANRDLRVQSVFSHLASSEDPGDDDFTRLQIRRFEAMSARILEVLDYPVLRHIVNSAGIHRFPEAQFDLVRLGIGLYGVGSNAQEQAQLRNVSALKSVITQIKHIPTGETIGYNRKGKAERDMVIAIVPVGYADGLNRRLGNGIGRLYVNGQPAPIVGNISMDLTMVDITGLIAPKSEIRNPKSEIREGTEVIIFNDEHPVTELAATLETIPYEVLTGISRRVKRIYFYE
ncbi:MAG: bifunctional UDP-N-acetylmuramoyl-tripeptide:D-alanyl-D-alanine ligase/alanine racemase [Bacteroidetes bacterium]|nr:bifunctional UDP-N-acetylmuramoyl-tripeptide:D-alanyl-D-alanine ligase/alanine racemase [Bacteroidota bacterium]